MDKPGRPPVDLKIFKLLNFFGSFFFLFQEAHKMQRAKKALCVFASYASLGEIYLNLTTLTGYRLHSGMIKIKKEKE
jgi:hypothetical protein